MTDPHNAAVNLLEKGHHFSLSPQKRLRVRTHDSLRFGGLAIFATACFCLLMGLAGRFGLAGLGLGGAVSDERMAWASVIAALSFVFLCLYRSCFEIDLVDPLDGEVAWVQTFGGRSLRIVHCRRREVGQVLCTRISDHRHLSHEISLVDRFGRHTVLISGPETEVHHDRYPDVARDLACVLGVEWQMEEKRS